MSPAHLCLKLDPTMGRTWIEQTHDLETGSRSTPTDTKAANQTPLLQQRTLTAVGIVLHPLARRRRSQYFLSPQVVLFIYHVSGLLIRPAVRRQKWGDPLFSGSCEILGAASKKHSASIQLPVFGRCSFSQMSARSTHSALRSIRVSHTHALPTHATVYWLGFRLSVRVGFGLQLGCRRSCRDMYKDLKCVFHQTLKLT